MTAKPILVGVDSSPASTDAAQVGWSLAQLMLVDCYFVHATRDMWVSARSLLSAATATAAASPTAAAPEFEAAIVEAAHTRIANLLRDKLPERAGAGLRVEVGRAGDVLERLSRSLGAGMIVLGGKHHSALSRWLGGSTALHLARTADVPILVTVDPPARFERVLVAVDLAQSAKTVLREAEHFATTIEASLRAIHVVPIPPGEEVRTTLDQAELMATSSAILEQSIWPALTRPIDRVVRHGDALQVLHEEIESWSADLLVVGSHGEGFAKRALLGRLTEALIENLPISVMIVPVKHAPASHQVNG